MRPRPPGLGAGDDEVRGGDPARALDSVAAGYAGHAHRPRARGEHLGVPREAAIRDGYVGLGPPDLGEGVQLRDGPRQQLGGHTFVQELQDPGLLDGRMHACEWWGLEGEEPDRPHQHEGEHEPERRAPEAVERLRGWAREPVPQSTTGGARRDLPERREGEDAHERDTRAEERVLALWHQIRRYPGAQGSPHDHPHEREDAGKEAGPGAAQHGQEDKQHYEEVEGRHPTDSTAGAPSLSKATLSRVAYIIRGR